MFGHPVSFRVLAERGGSVVHRGPCWFFCSLSAEWRRREVALIDGRRTLTIEKRRIGKTKIRQPQLQPTAAAPTDAMNNFHSPQNSRST